MNKLKYPVRTHGYIWCFVFESIKKCSVYLMNEQCACKACQIIGMSQNCGSKFALTLSPTFCLVNGAKMLVKECSRESCFQLELILCDKAGKCAKTLPIQLHFFANCRSLILLIDFPRLN